MTKTLLNYHWWNALFNKASAGTVSNRMRWKGQFPKNLVEDPESGKIICRENCEWKL